MSKGKMSAKRQYENLMSCDASRAAYVYRYRYETKIFSYKNDSWGSREVASVSMESVYESYNEYRTCDEWN